jgi:hypothetical protein
MKDIKRHASQLVDRYLDMETTYRNQQSNQINKVVEKVSTKLIRLKNNFRLLGSTTNMTIGQQEI